LWIWAEIADLATVALIGLAIVASLFPINISAIDLTIRRWSRPLIAAVAIAALRHVLVRTPSLPSRIATLWSAVASRSPAMAFAVPVAMITRTLVLLVGYFGAITIPFPADAPFVSARATAWWDLPRRWDAGWYLSIAKDGYQWTGDVAASQNLNFFPAYPLAVRSISSVFDMRHVSDEAALAWTATIVSIGAFAAALTYLYWFVDEQFDGAVAAKSVVLLASYPFAVFYSAAYSESLFLLAAIAAWYHFRRDEALLSMAFGLVAGLCRPNGALLSVPLLVEMVRLRRLSPLTCAAALAPAGGMVLFSAFAYHLTGHPLVWVESQRTAFGRTYRPFSDTVWAELQVLADIGIVQYLAAWPWRVLNLVPTVFSLASLWPVGRRLGAAAALFIALNTLLPLLNGGLVSMGRYTSVLFPMFVWLACVAEDKWLAVLACGFGLGQSLVAIAFFTWRQIF
jgi:hypothetical protein